MKKILIVVSIFSVVISFMGCGSSSSSNSYVYTPIEDAQDMMVEPEEGECVPQLVDGGDGTSSDDDNSDDDDDDDTQSMDANSDPAMPDNGRDDDDDEEEDPAAVNTAPLAYTVLGKVNVIVDCLIYPLVTATSADRSIEIVAPTSTLQRMLSPTQPSPYMGLYKIQLGAYAIREERLYLDEGYLVFEFIMPDNEVNGYFRLINPPNKSGVVHVTYVEDQNAGFKMEGEMIDAEIYTNEDRNETYKMSLNFSTTILERF